MDWNGMHATLILSAATRLRKETNHCTADINLISQETQANICKTKSFFWNTNSCLKKFNNKNLNPNT